MAGLLNARASQASRQAQDKETNAGSNSARLNQQDQCNRYHCNDQGIFDDLSTLVFSEKSDDHCASLYRNPVDRIATIFF
ncbi:hypothetical protein QTH98_17780 [Variovorax sp. J22G47]|nr:hypothetical protein [Variovorax sp. J22G47]